MKRSLIIAVLMLLSSTVAFGATNTQPDYSRDAILKMLHEMDVTETPVKTSLGMLEINTQPVRVHIAYLPLLASIPYAGPYGEMFLPNPFVLTNTQYAYRAHQYKALPEDYSNDREYSREYNRSARMIAKMQ